VNGIVEVSGGILSGGEIAEPVSVASTVGMVVVGDVENLGVETIWGVAGTALGTGGGSWYRRGLGRRAGLGRR
jgi:hypothetical protein